MRVRSRTFLGEETWTDVLALLNISFFLIALVISLVCYAGAAEQVFQTGFETPAEREAWPESEFVAWETGGFEGGTSLRITADEAEGSHMLRVPLNLAPYRGYRLLLECMAKAEGVTKPPAKHLGVKFMLHYQSDLEGALWQNEDNVFGTFDWKKLEFTTLIAPDARDAEISLGLQDSSGTVWFDGIKITVLEGPPAPRPAPPESPPPAFKGHDLPRLRGVMSPQEFRDEDLRVLGMEWNANVIRWQITRDWGKPGVNRDLADYDRWMEDELADLDKALEACLRYGIKVVVDLHTPAGGRYPNGDLAMLYEPKYAEHFVELWEKIARRYKGHPAIWGYDLVNEPKQNKPVPDGMPGYLGAQVLAAKAVRAIDPDTPIFIEAGEWASPDAFRRLEPVDVPRVIYEVHMYKPGQFTHQGVNSEWKPVTYPGRIGGTLWNKEQLRRVLEPVREFQLAYNVHIYVGEFSAVRWAPGAADYLRDCIELFEEYGWDWTYHAYREWTGWSVEHGEDPEGHQPAKEPTERKKVLLEWFAKNEKPRE